MAEAVCGKVKWGEQGNQQNQKLLITKVAENAEKGDIQSGSHSFLTSH